MDRRNFLKQTGTLIATATLLPSALARDQATAEGRPFAGDELNRLLMLAAGGIRQLTEHQRTLLPANFSAWTR